MLLFSLSIKLGKSYTYEFHEDCGTYIIGRAKRAPHWGVQSRFRVIYIYMYVGMYVCCGPKSVGGNTWAKRAHAQSQYCAGKIRPVTPVLLISTVYAIAALAWTEEKRSLRNEKLKAKRAT